MCKWMNMEDMRIRLLLTPKQYYYYTEHISKGRSQTEIAKERGVTRAAVSKSVQEARERILKYMEGGKRK